MKKFIPSQFYDYTSEEKTYAIITVKVEYFYDDDGHTVVIVKEQPHYSGNEYFNVFYVGQRNLSDEWKERAFIDLHTLFGRIIQPFYDELDKLLNWGKEYYNVTECATNALNHAIKYYECFPEDRRCQSVVSVPTDVAIDRIARFPFHKWKVMPSISDFWMIVRGLTSSTEYIFIDPDEEEEKKKQAAFDKTTNAIIRKTMREMQRQTPLATEQRRMMRRVAEDMRASLARGDWSAIKKLAAELENFSHDDF